MDPLYIYFKEINIDQNKSFTTDFSKEYEIEEVLFNKNEIEEVLFNKENEYGITSSTVNSILPDKKKI